MRSISKKRYYFDYNATSPLSQSVQDFLGSGDLFFANPNALHYSARKAQKIVEDTALYLKNLFSLSLTHEVFFHSGATEGGNTFLNSFIKKRNGKASIFYSNVDHSYMEEFIRYCEQEKNENLKFIQFSVSKTGDFDIEDLILKMKKEKNPTFLHFTWANNETGIIWDLKLAERIKKETDCFLYVDATQSPFKIKNWKNLSTYLDAYSYSGHKFGALSGVGFSFYKKKEMPNPLVIGNPFMGKSSYIRGSTPNTLGIYTLFLSLKEFEELDVDKNILSRRTIEESLLNMGFKIVGEGVDRLSNTICTFHMDFKAQDLLLKFDTKGIDVGIGSACSSYQAKENRILINMGYSKKEALSSIRLSFGPQVFKHAKEYVQKIISCF